MKFLFDLFPVILFFIAFQFADIYVATGVAMAATVAQIAWVKLKGRRIDPMLWMSFGIIVVFGGATLILHDATFIKWKPTVLYWIFAVVLVGSELFFHKNMIRELMRGQIELPDAVWRRLSWVWAAFFALTGVLNLYVAFNFSEATWVKFKVFGVTGLTLVFVLAQGLFLARYVEDEKP